MDGGTVAIVGGMMVGWVSGAGSAGGIDAGPEGGAILRTGPPGASGIADGGTGGGRSENIWAELGAEMKETSPNARVTATASAGKDRLARPFPPIPLPHEIMAMLFTENAANSSLQQAAAPCHVEPAGTFKVSSTGRGPVTMPA